MLLVTKEIAARLRCSAKTAIRLMESGQLPGAFQLTKRGHWRMRSQDLEDYLQRKTGAAGTSTALPQFTQRIK